MRVVITGPCASGKTTLVSALREAGIDAYNVAQEHSGIKKLWQKKQPDVLVLLDVNLPAVRARRSVPWGNERLLLQRERLKDAKENANLFIQTDNLCKEEVLQTVLAFIEQSKHNE